MTKVQREKVLLCTGFQSNGTVFVLKVLPLLKAFIGKTFVIC